MIARRSKEFAGTRFLKRGANDEVRECVEGEGAEGKKEREREERGKGLSVIKTCVCKPR